MNPERKLKLELSLIVTAIGAIGCEEKTPSQGQKQQINLDAYRPKAQTRKEVEVLFRDVDGDGYGDPATKTATTGHAKGFVDQAGDCDDTNSKINPDSPDEEKNGVDDDCDGFLDTGSRVPRVVHRTPLIREPIRIIGKTIFFDNADPATPEKCQHNGEIARGISGLCSSRVYEVMEKPTIGVQGIISIVKIVKGPEGEPFTTDAFKNARLKAQVGCQFKGGPDDIREVIRRVESAQKRLCRNFKSLSTDKSHDK